MLKTITDRLHLLFFIHPSRLMLAFAIVVHLTMLASWRLGFLNPLFFDATVTHGRRGWDFYALYQAGHNVLTNHSVYESDGARIDMVIPDGTYTPFRYLPVSAYTVGVLLNFLSPLWAYRLWVAFVEGCLLACVILTYKWAAPARRTGIIAMWLCYTPFYLELYMGQFSFVQGTLVFLMLFIASEEKKPGFLADMAWIGSVLWKQNTALFLPLMIRLKKWRTLGILALALLLTSVPYFALFPGSWTAFLHNFASEPPWFQLGNLGFRQLVFDTMWSVADTWKLAIPQSIYAGAQTATMAILISIPLFLTVLSRKPDVLLHLALWMTAYFLAYHHVWEHHYVMLLPVLIALTIRRPSPWVWAIYILLALPTPFYLIDPRGQVAVLDAMRWTPIRPLWQDLVYHASKSIPALLLYLFLVVQIAHPIIAEWRQQRFYLWPFTREIR